jgi:hypothetical protein
MNIDMERIYKEQFNKTYNFLKSSLTGDKVKDIEVLENTIKILLVSQGNDWIGRGELAQTKQSASIAAAEELKAVLKENLE